MKVDPSIYNTPEFPMPEGTQTQPATQYTPPAPVGHGAVLDGTLSQQQGQQAAQEAARPTASAWESVKAAGANWDTTRVLQAFAGPDFEPEEGFQAGSLLQGIPMTLDKSEREFMLESKSRPEWQYRLATLERNRSTSQAMGDNPTLSFVTSMLDPAYLAVDLASMGAGIGVQAMRAGYKASRIAAGVTAAAGSVGIGMIASTQTPVSYKDIALNAVLNGAAAGMFYRAGKIGKVDPEFPDQTLHTKAEQLRVAVNEDMGVAARMDFQAPKGDKTGRDLLDHIESIVGSTGKHAELLAALSRSPELDSIKVSTGAKAQAKMPDARGFNYRTPTANLVFVRGQEGVDTGLHELVHATVQQRIKANPTVRKEFEQVQAAVLDSLDKLPQKGTQFLRNQMGSNLNEFIAYSLTSPTFRKWAESNRITAAGTKATAWDSIVGAVQRVLNAPLDAVRAVLGKAPRQYGPKALHKHLDDLLRAVDAQGVQRVDEFSKGFISPAKEVMDEAKARTSIANSLDKLDKKFANKVSWSLHKTLASYGDIAKSIADKYVDNPLVMSGDSIVSQQRAIRADFSARQYEFEELLKKELAARGAGTWARIFKPEASRAVQRQIDREVALEMLARERAQRLNMPTRSTASPAVAAMADKLGSIASDVLKAMKAAGVEGAEDIAENAGYFSRKWDISKIEDTKGRIAAALDLTEEAAQKVIEDMVAKGLSRANSWDKDLSGKVARAILDRAKRKGYFEDSAFRAHAGNAAAKELRDMLSGHLNPQEIDKVMGVITGVVDEANKLSNLKHRVDIDMKVGFATPTGQVITVADLIDTDMVKLTQQYLDRTAGRIAMARKQVFAESDIAKDRTALAHSITDLHEREQAINLFDDVTNSILGNPVGERMPEFMRNMQAFTRMVGLSSSGLWQMTEYAPIMARYGALKTLKYAMKELNFRSLRSDVRASRRSSSELVDILSRNAAQDMRIRPFVDKMEDNFVMSPTNVVQSALMQAQQLVPYINAQKLVQNHQARVAANLIVDTLGRGARGDAKAIEALRGYGLESHIVNKYRHELRNQDTSTWPDELWAEVRGPLNKMVDDAVLRARTGEIPAFAQFTSVGKFVFTFRSFVLAAHNKVLAGTMNRDGIHGLGLLMLYQFPLVMLATEANAVLSGKPLKDDKELVSRSFGQMGSLGLFSELFGVITGQKDQFGAPGLIAIDRMYKLAGTASDAVTGGQSDAGDVAAQTLQVLPIISNILPIKAIGESLKE